MSSDRHAIPEGAVVAALAIHNPRPEHKDDWIAIMEGVGASGRENTGFLGIAGFRDLNSDRLVAISYWESEEALERMLPAATAAANSLDEQWGAGPTDVLVLRPL